MAGLDIAGINQAIGLAQGQAMKIIGGIPILKNALGSTLERLKLPKHLEAGNIQNILAAVQNGGIGSLLQAPLGAALGSLTEAISSAESAVTSALGGGAGDLVSTLSSLSGSAANLGDLASNLAGVTNTQGLANQFDLIGHMNLAQSFGDLIPPSLSLATAVAPITSSELLSTVTSQVESLAGQVAAGSMSASAGATAIAGLQAQMDAVANGSANAISSLAAAGPALAAATSTVALLISGPPEMQAAMTAAIQPSMLSTVQGIVSDHLASILGAP